MDRESKSIAAISAACGGGLLCVGKNARLRVNRPDLLFLSEWNLLLGHLPPDVDTSRGTELRRFMLVGRASACDSDHDDMRTSFANKVP